MYNNRIADMADYEKPIEKLFNEGADKLSDAELLAIVLRTGNRNQSVISLSQLILDSHPVYKGLAGLNHRHVNEFMELHGVGRVKAAQLVAITEISKRISSVKAREKLTFSSVDSVADYFMEDMRYLGKERVYALLLANDNSMLHKILISEGSVDRCILTPRELFIEALRYNASNIIILHNHPSGNPEPSTADILLTERINNLGKELGIYLNDHIIIGDGIYYSMLEQGLIK